MRSYLIAPYAECVKGLKDPRLVRNRTTATGGARFPLPIPRKVKVLMGSMITEDGAAHRRQRTLVAKAFTPRAIGKLASRVEDLTHELLNTVEREREVDLMEVYSLPIPVTVIREMLGVDEEDMPRFRDGMRSLKEGFNGLSLIRTLVWDLPGLMDLMKEIIERKRKQPADDILTALVEAEEEGDRLSMDELVSMSLLLILAGYETTVHLITNAVLTLLDHPDALERIKADATLIEPAIEEILRYSGPVEGAKPEYATEDLEVRGVRIPKGSMVLYAFGAANKDPSVFEDPYLFDIERSPNKHLGFGHGAHFCLGAGLARMETRTAIKTLFDRFPDVRLAVPRSDLKPQAAPMWNRYASLPVVLR